MQHTEPPRGFQPRASIRSLCTGCARRVGPPFNTLTDHGALLALLCGACDQRHDDDAVFARIVDACARGGRTVREVTAAFAVFGLAVPTTAAALRVAAARISGGAAA